MNAKAATVLYRALDAVKKRAFRGFAMRYSCKLVSSQLDSERLASVDYAEVVDAEAI